MTNQANALSFKVSHVDGETIQKIVDRALPLFADMPKRQRPTRMDIMMDITATHASGNPLRLEALLGADDFNFAHDIYGIRDCLDRDTGQMMNFFSPRFTDTAARKSNS